MLGTRKLDLVINKRKLKRVDWNTVKKIIIALYRSGKMKKTSLSMHCRISYDRGLLYLQWLETLGLIRNEIDEEGFELIGLSIRGAELYKKEFEHEQIDPLN